ncbi:hypothetical protein AXG93_4409s1020 [Marchantia polymorpha subsp. ruderalis]|uniref:Uncharacterized protein n=1 Tax=Marchantia polymorpha subsp. ruderalis TaxID=1480154 RepID=A0A176WTD7_MARPO|nr:hypothetical protein AXG93_4409s1020 [Marchantia polymorpha subsp. ruderalis]
MYSNLKPSLHPDGKRTYTNGYHNQQQLWQKLPYSRLKRARVPEVIELVTEDMEYSDKSGNITTGSANSNNSAPKSNTRTSFMKMAVEERETGEGNARWKVEDAQQKIRELIPEMRYQRELNFSLIAQVRKTQDSNMELVLAIKDVEESLEESR